MKKNRIKNLMFYCGVDRDDFDFVREMIWQRNDSSLNFTAAVTAIIGFVFLILNLFLKSSVMYPYIFLISGSTAVLIVHLATIRRKRSEMCSMALCYAQMILTCVYAGMLGLQPGNYEIPATSVIVFIALLPLTIDDRPIRMCIVMIGESTIYLVLSYIFKSSRAFSLDVMNIATFCVVGMVLYTIICSRNVGELHASGRIRNIQLSIISALASVVEERDENTGGHIQRTEDYVEKLIGRMIERPEYSGLTEDYLSYVILAAPMHDIGKIKIPDSILNKPGKLTDEEYGIMKKHSEYGGNIIRRTIGNVEDKEYCDIAYNIARYHHERYDGKGYPEGLKGEEIPLEARIMALADVYDALISERVYKKAFSREKARQIILEESGAQFDPLLTELFLECV